MELESLPDFSGKVVVLYLSGEVSSTGVILEYATFKCLGGRLFVEGRHPEIRFQEWTSHLESGVAWDDVTNYLVFDSREDCESRLTSQLPGSVLSRVWAWFFGQSSPHA